MCVCVISMEPISTFQKKKWTTHSDIGHNRIITQIQSIWHFIKSRISKRKRIDNFHTYHQHSLGYQIIYKKIWTFQNRLLNFVLNIVLNSVFTNEKFKVFSYERVWTVDIGHYVIIHVKLHQFKLEQIFVCMQWTHTQHVLGRISSESSTFGYLLKSIK